MKKIYIFTITPDGYSATRLSEEINLTHNEYKIISYGDILINLNNNHLPIIIHKNIPLPDPDIAIFRGIAGLHPIQNALIQLYSQKKVRILNHKCYLRWTGFNKVTQHIILNQNQLPHVPTQTSGNINLLSSNNFPLIIKPAKGSHGNGVVKITKPDELKSLPDSKYYPYLAQDFLTEGKDIRIIIINNQVIGAMLRKAPQGHYITNYSTGGIVENYDLTEHPELINLAQKAAQTFDCEYAGIDFMLDNNGQWKILELNRACEFKGFEESTQINIAQNIINHLLSTTH